MSQRKNKIYNFINNPLIYKIIQGVMSGTSFRNNIIKKNITKNNLKILDIGCGPAQILEHIPKCDYYGYDIDRRSIQYAKKKYYQKNYHFYCKKFNKTELKKLPKFDFIIFFGILHHLSNKEVYEILKLCKKIMKKNSKLLTEDPILLENQNVIAKFLIKKDRGLNVRKKQQYIDLLKKHFKKIKNEVTHQYFIPYTWFTTICSK
jgi:2-polyprenyl-3-methyl-5-hydroxy-6-metoxy-1,4-benzoquinol methylase